MHLHLPTTTSISHIALRRYHWQPFILPHWRFLRVFSTSTRWLPVIRRHWRFYCLTQLPLADCQSSAAIDVSIVLLDFHSLINCHSSAAIDVSIVLLDSHSPHQGLSGLTPRIQWMECPPLLWRHELASPPLAFPSSCATSIHHIRLRSFEYCAAITSKLWDTTQDALMLFTPVVGCMADSRCWCATGAHAAQSQIPWPQESAPHSFNIQVDDSSGRRLASPTHSCQARALRRGHTRDRQQILSVWELNDYMIWSDLLPSSSIYICFPELLDPEAL